MAAGDGSLLLYRAGFKRDHYEVKSDTGQVYRRNRRHLRKVPTPILPEDQDSSWDNDHGDQLKDVEGNTCEQAVSLPAEVPMRRPQRPQKIPASLKDFDYELPDMGRERLRQ